MNKEKNFQLTDSVTVKACCMHCCFKGVCVCFQHPELPAQLAAHICIQNSHTKYTKYTI